MSTSNIEFLSNIKSDLEKLSSDKIPIEEKNGIRKRFSDDMLQSLLKSDRNNYTPHSIGNLIIEENKSGEKKKEKNEYIQLVILNIYITIFINNFIVELYNSKIYETLMKELFHNCYIYSFLKDILNFWNYGYPINIKFLLSNDNNKKKLNSLLFYSKNNIKPLKPLMFHKSMHTYIENIFKDNESLYTNPNITTIEMLNLPEKITEDNIEEYKKIMGKYKDVSKKLSILIFSSIAKSFVNSVNNMCAIYKFPIKDLKKYLNNSFGINIDKITDILQNDKDNTWITNMFIDSNNKTIEKKNIISENFNYIHDLYFNIFNKYIDIYKYIIRFNEDNMLELNNYTTDDRIYMNLSNIPYSDYYNSFYNYINFEVKFDNRMYEKYDDETDNIKSFYKMNSILDPNLNKTESNGRYYNLPIFK